MREFLDLVNELKGEYPELERDFNEVMDMCLKALEKGGNKDREILIHKSLLLELIRSVDEE